MSNQVYRYKGYIGSAEVDTETKKLKGKLLHINGLVTYTAETPTQLEEEFRISVDEYIAFCKEEGLEPEKPCSGSFNVRIAPELHRKAAHEATAEGVSLNVFVGRCIDDYFKGMAMRKRVEAAVGETIAKDPTFSREMGFTQKLPFGHKEPYGFKQYSVGNH